MKILQISDTHIYDDPSKKLGGVCTRDSLIAVLNTAKEKHQFDLIIVTGDFNRSQDKMISLSPTALNQFVSPRPSTSTQDKPRMVKPAVQIAMALATKDD